MQNRFFAVHCVPLGSGVTEQAWFYTPAGHCNVLRTAEGLELTLGFRAFGPSPCMPHAPALADFLCGYVVEAIVDLII